MSLSVIIPVHNTERYLDECMNSVLSEINTDDEIILVENGSVDHSWEICKKYAEKFNTVKAVQMETAGVSRARNYGIRLAKGEWIAFLDSDDCLDPSLIHMARKLKDDPEPDVVLFHYQYLDAPVTYPEKDLVSEELKQVDSDLLRRGVLQFGKYEKAITKSTSLDNMSIWTCWGKLFRKRLIDDNKIRFPEALFLSEDTAFVFQVYCSTDKIYAAQMNAYYYRETPGSITRTVNIRTINNNRYLRKWIMNYVKNQGLEKILEEELSVFLVRKFIEECFYLRICKEKSRAAKLRYTRKNAEDPDLKKALHEVKYRGLIPGKKHTITYGLVLWFLKRKYYKVLYFK